MAARRKAAPHAATVAERVAILETELEAHDASDREHFTAMKSAFERINARLDGIEEKLNRQKGFIGGVVFVVSAIWGVVVMLFKSKFGG